jgi:hypothetical protein
MYTKDSIDPYFIHYQALYLFRNTLANLLGDMTRQQRSREPLFRLEKEVNYADSIFDRVLCHTKPHTSD